MTGSRINAIKEFCRDCAGTPLETTLCTIFYCSLWPHRIGGLGTRGYKNRIKMAFEGNSLALNEAKSCGLTLEDFLRPTKDSINKIRPFRKLADYQEDEKTEKGDQN